MKKRIRYIRSLTIIILLAAFKLQAQDDSEADINRANQYMNQSSIESLINAFDSPDRSRWQKPDEVIDLFGDVSYQKIMDLGAGSGYFTLRLAAKGAQVIAADVSGHFQETIKEKLENEDIAELSGHIELRKVAYDDPGLDKEEVDGILIVNTWHHIDNRRSYLQKALTGVKEGGKIIVVDFKLGVAGGPPDSHKLGMEEALNEIKGLNIKEIRTDTTLLGRQYILIISK